MFILQQTGIYKDCNRTIGEILNLLTKKKEDIIMVSAAQECLQISANLAKALQNIEDEDQYSLFLRKVDGHAAAASAMLSLAVQRQEISGPEAETITSRLEQLTARIAGFLKSRKKILILSSIMGQGHMSASKAMQQGMEKLYGLDYRVEIVDFWEEMNASFNKATKKAYEGSTKFAPKLYKLIFAGTDTKWQIKLINQLNYPFVLAKVKKLFEEKNPDLVISTYPIWNYLIAEIWKKVKPHSKFLSVVTDSISIHNAWAIADTDYHIVANEDTELSLRKLGVNKETIKALGFPVRLDFMQETNRTEFLAAQGLDPKKYTILFLPTAQRNKLSLQIMQELMEKHSDCNIITIVGRDLKLKPLLEKAAAGGNVKIIGWTDQMPDFIKSADIVVTKAGGATVMECIAAKKPMVITSIIPGQEEGNGELIKRHHLGILPHESGMSISESINYIRQNRKQFEKSLQESSNPQAALKIAAFIHSILS